MKNVDSVLICPLNWGLGHASRIIPIAKYFLSKNKNVIIACDDNAYELVKNEIKQVKLIRFSSFQPKYKKNKLNKYLFIKWSFQIIYHTIKEHFSLKKIIKKHRITIIISDNRYGLWNKNTKSIIITHQVFIKLSGALRYFEPIVHKITKMLISKFDYCWIPDYKGKVNYSGELSHSSVPAKQYQYIGLLSRFHDIKINQTPSIYELIVIISGVEQQRTILENRLINQIKKTSYKTLFIRGLPSSFERYPPKIDNIDFQNHLDTENFIYYIKNTKYIICRAGYSTIMDLIILNKSAILIPTPGQTEQEYLAKYLSEKKLFVVMKQNNPNINTAIQQLNNTKKHKFYKPILFHHFINQLLEQ